MVHEDISQDRQFGVDGGNLAEFRLEGGAEAVERGGRVQLRYLADYLAADELAFEVCRSQKWAALTWI